MSPTLAAMTTPGAESATERESARTRRRRVPLWAARLFARTLRRSGIATSILLGLASVLTAVSAYLATQYADAATQFDSLANRATVDSVAQAQEDYAQHFLDSQVWVAIVASGQTVDESPLGTLLSDAWLSAVERAAVDEGDLTPEGGYLLPLDDRYFDELTVESRAYLDQQQRAFETARVADTISARITGASIMYSAALLLLTVATTTTRNGGKLALNTAAAIIMIVALVVGWPSPISSG
jgi:hypothetical protein